MDLTLHLHPAAATAAALAGAALEAIFRGTGCYPKARANAWITGLLSIASIAVVALIMAEILARLGIGSLAGGALGGVALGALYAAPRLAEGASARHGLRFGVCRLAQFALMGAVIGGLH